MKREPRISVGRGGMAAYLGSGHDRSGISYYVHKSPPAPAQKPKREGLAENLHVYDVAKGGV